MFIDMYLGRTLGLTCKNCKKHYESHIIKEFGEEKVISFSTVEFLTRKVDL